MKHPPVLMLGLAAFILGSSPAYAEEPLNFDPTPAPTIRSDTTSSTLIAAINPLKSQPQQTQTPKPANLPLFELPPFQSSSSETADRPQKEEAPSYLSANSDFNDRYSSSKPSVAAAPDIPSPFQLPDDLTDAELFESDSVQEQEINSLQSDGVSRNYSEAELGSTSNIDASSSPETSQFKRFNDEISDARSGISSSPEISPETSDEISSNVSSEISSEVSSRTASEKSIGLSFDPPVATKSSSTVAQSLPAPVLAESPDVSSIASKPVESSDGHSLDRLFQGDSDSIVAVAVGSAEGTRSPDGGKNPAYQGHTDPGNGVWNLGSFSYQHGASSPEEADAKQLARLRNQAQIILDKAAAKGLDLSLEEKLNGIDLANQAPKAALDDLGGYIDWLADARASGLGGNDAILWARVNSFLDPYTQTWNAPGLGNSEERITSDQERRMLAIAKAIATYVQDSLRAGE